MRFILLATTLLNWLAVSALPNGTPARPGPNPPPVVPTDDLEQIRYTLSLYPMAVDSKDFSAFSEIFFDDVQSNYGAPLGNVSGVAALENSLKTILANVTTLHLVSNPNILIYPNRTTALVVSKVQASHFGQGDYAGQEYLLFGQYRDVFQRCGQTWKIVERISYAIASFGNITIFGSESANA